jgi:excinuclease ABC subunit A
VRPKLFIFDEPSTGLHFHDIQKLLNAFNSLIEKGHSITVIEHHHDIIKVADWLIDMGPEGGRLGGNVVFAGTPEALLQHDATNPKFHSYTAQFLRKTLSGAPLATPKTANRNKNKNTSTN